MSKQEKHAYLEAIQRRYHKADRASKARILDEFCAVFSGPLNYRFKYTLLGAGAWKTNHRHPRNIATVYTPIPNNWTR